MSLVLSPSASLCWAGPGRGAGLELNEATRAEIEAVRGVGVELADRILQARAQARFRDWTDARQRVKGLGKRAMSGFAEAAFHIGGQEPPGASAP